MDAATETKLPSDVWCLISSKLEAATDRIRLRAVSKYLASSLPAYQPIWLMLSQDRSGEFYDGDAMRRLLLDDDDQEPLPPPPRRGLIQVGVGEHMDQLSLPEADQKHCVSSTGSWMVTVDLEGSISLLNVFTRLQMDLPSRQTFSHGKNYSESDLMNGYLKKLVFSSSHLINSKDWVAMAIYSIDRSLAFCRRGDTSWTDFIVDIPLKFQDSMCECEDIIYFRGKFHIVDVFGEVAAYNMDTRSMEFFSGNHHPGRRYVTRGPFYRRYLVEWMGELLLVKREWVPDNPNTCQFYVFKRDFINREWVELNDLGQYCLFLGLNTSVAVSVLDYPLGSLKRNCVYFTANQYADPFNTYHIAIQEIADDMGVFSLEDRSIQPLYHGICTPCSLPLWIIPHHYHN